MTSKLKTGLKGLMATIFGAILLGGLFLPTFTPLSVAEEAEADRETITEAVQQSSMLVQMKQKLAQTQYRYYLLETNLERALGDLVSLQDMIEHLKIEVDKLELSITDTDKKILSVKRQKEVKKMDLEGLEEEAFMLELQLEDQKVLIGELMMILYVKRDIYYDEDGVNTVKVLASPDTVSETLQGIKYLDLIEELNEDETQKMIGLTEDLAGKWATIRRKQDELNNLDIKLATELNNQQEERDIQVALLDETVIEQSVLEVMLASSDDRKEDLLREIDALDRNVSLMQQKFSGTEVLLSSEQQDLISRIEEDMKEQFRSEEVANFLDMKWPVNPKDGLTAFFIDGGYQKAFGVQHYALDIRSKHGSNIYSPADGVVYDIIYDKDSTRYAYVMIAHRKGVMSLVGHVSGVTVEVGYFVSEGDIIALSGATPGSIGAGVRTTGPHLHFEVWQDGARVDPLKYLPLDEVPVEHLPEEYLAEIQKDLESEIKRLQGELN
ncbi:peptidoglycan DD-metalloendopeptidase family protein [Candidatus Peregrinibacteria bacterium]|nr:peptidoglycan DD-metalloendopeptidase family protein [Candidatus Peregrinibacteria bacterium]